VRFCCCLDVFLSFFVCGLICWLFFFSRCTVLYFWNLRLVKHLWWSPWRFPWIVEQDRAGKKRRGHLECTWVYIRWVLYFCFRIPNQIANFICIWSEIKWRIWFDLKSNGELDLYLIWNQMSNLICIWSEIKCRICFDFWSQIKWPIWFEFDLKSRLRTWNNQYRDLTEVRNDLNWFWCLIVNQGFNLKQSVPRSNRSLKWSELILMLDRESRLRFETISTEIKPEFEMIWVVSDAWSGIKAWIRNNQYRDQTGVW